MTETTSMFFENFSPGMRQQMPRTLRRISTPAWEAVVEGGDDVRILEGVGFPDDFRGEALPGPFRFPGDEVEEAWLHGGGGGDEALEAEEL